MNLHSSRAFLEKAMRISWLATLVCCLTIAADDPDSALDANHDLDLMQGIWTRVSSEAGGNKRLHGEPRPLLIIAGDEFTFGFDKNGKSLDPERVKVDQTQLPKAIDFTPTGESAGPLKGKTYPGIYKIEGDTLILCLSIEPGSKRPTKFATKDNQWLLDVYRRPKAPAP
jgi:uncharacterized protein (TIGR03067 family)